MRQAEKTVTEIHRGRRRAVAARADVADEHAMAAVFDLAEAEFGALDVAVNAAGIVTLAPIATSTSTPR